MVAMWVDPKKLQLTPVGARDYIELLTLGQSVGGNMIVETIPTQDIESEEPQSHAESMTVDDQPEGTGS